jgi:group I intron endonuclease
VNVITFDSYIGSSKNYPERWAGHRRSLRDGVHRNWRIQEAWVKHGEGAFVFNVLERVVGNAGTLREREQHYLDTLHPTYNIRKRTSGIWDASIEALFASKRGLKISPETLAKMVEKRQPLTEETRTCTECGGNLFPRPGRRFTCSDECRVARNKRHVQSGAYREERECVECEAPFTVSNRSKDTETCSKRCAALRWRRSEREERTIDGNLMCREKLHVIEAGDPRCAECYKVSNRARYHRSVADIPRRSWSHDGPRSAKRKIVG